MSADAQDGCWFRIGPLAELPDQRPCWKRAGGAELAVVRLGESVHALADTCPHQGASLSGGRVVAGQLRCPAHGLAFNLSTGRMGTSPLTTPCFRTEVRGTDVWVHVPTKPLS